MTAEIAEHRANAMSGRGSSTSGHSRVWEARPAVLLLAVVLSIGGMSGPANAAEDNGTWARTGSLATSRAFFTATLLRSGKVLVVGGLQDPRQPVALASSEVYDPATGKWASTGSLETARYRHSATLLSSGKVLVVGGLRRDLNQPPTALGSAELYDPTTGKWAKVRSLAVARVGHTATLLESGKVLVAGGGRADTATEIYDPATDRWADTTPIPTARSEHSATLLKSGRVLVVGGEQPRVASDTGNIFAASVVYDPATAEWSMASRSGGRRARHTAALLGNGKVLVAGGVTSPAAGGANNPTDLGGRTVAVELYDPTGDTWGVTQSLPFAPVFQDATALNSGNVLLVGLPFYKPGDAPQVSVQLYDTNARLWEPVKTRLLTVRAFAPSLTLLKNGEVLMVAGEERATYLYRPQGSGSTSRPWVWAGIVAMSVLAFVFVVTRRRLRRRTKSARAGGFAPR